MNKGFSNLSKILAFMVITLFAAVALLSCEGLNEAYTGGVIRVENLIGSQITVDTITGSDAVVLYKNVIIDPGDYRDFTFDKAGSYSFAFGNSKTHKVNLKDGNVILLTITNY